MESKKGGRGSKKYGRNEKKCQAYRTARRRERNKLKRIKKSNGEEAALEYSIEKGI